MKKIEWEKLTNECSKLEFSIYDDLLIRVFKSHDAIAGCFHYEVRLVSRGITTSILFATNINDGFEGRPLSPDEFFYEKLFKPLLRNMQKSLQEIEKTFEEEE